MKILLYSLLGVVGLLIGVVLILSGITLLRRRQAAGGGGNGGPSGGRGAMKYLWPAVVVIGGIVLAIGLWWLWKAPSGALEAPSVADAVKWSREYWLWVIILWGVGHALIGLNSSTLGKAAPVLHWVLPVTVFALYAVLPIIGWASGSKTADELKAEKETAARAAAVPKPAPALRVETPVLRPEGLCTKTAPCRLTLFEGRTRRVHLPEGLTFCPDPRFYTDLPNLGYKTSFRGVERNPGCSDGKCFSDTFWFEPKKGVEVPLFWFVPTENGSAETTPC